jgi:(p)ppGpp synthase/HD superfamily hydrolase
MRTLHALPPEKARAVAAETLSVWCSLAARLGVWTIKAELEDLCFAVLMPATFLRLKSTLDTIWSGRGAGAASAQTARSDEELMAELMASVPPEADQGLTPEQLRTRALLSCVLPFDLLTPRQWDSGVRASTVMTGAPASAAAALEALMACQKALRDELRLSAVAPGLEVTVQGRLKSLWSTHMKMQRKACGAREVYDARALRVVVEDTSTHDAGVETEACYSLLSAVHKLWKPVGGEYDNYIANPVRGFQRPSGSWEERS